MRQLSGVRSTLVIKDNTCIRGRSLTILHARLSVGRRAAASHHSGRSAAPSSKVKAAMAQDANSAARKTVAIVGGGVSGIVSARFVKDEGMAPLIFEKSSSLGGLWGALPTYKALRTNISNFNMRFSDFPWPDSAPLYPTKEEFGGYLSEYFTAHFPGGAAGVVQLGSEVTRVAPAGGPNAGGWEVAWREADGNFNLRIFDHVIIASGYFGDPRLPPLRGQASFHGPLLHSSEYLTPGPFTDMRVAVVGSSISSTEIAADIASTAASVTNIVPRPFWVLPRYLPSHPADPATPFLPMEFALLSRGGSTSVNELMLVSEQLFIKQHAMFAAICGDQGQTVCPELAVPDGGRPQFVGLSNSYAALARAGRITVARGRLAELRGRRLVLDDGAVLPGEFDAVVFATGHQPRVGFLPEELLQRMEYDGEDGFLPLLLHKSTWHPALRGAAFVGVHPRPFVPTVELQARWVAGVLGGRLPAPSEAEQLEGVAAERGIREQKLRGQFAHPDPWGRQRRIAAEVDLLPPEEWVTKQEFSIPEYLAGDLAAADEATRKLGQALAAFKRGRMVGLMVFRGLQGRWQLRREIVGGREGQPSGRVEGVGEFKMLGGDVNQYLYSERGVFAMQGGGQMKVSREYVWCYNEDEERIDVYFAEGGGGRGGFFHSVRVLAPDEEWPEGHGGVAEGGWRAAGDHLCVKDMYLVSYRFAMAGIRVKELEVRYDVEGPNKQYSSTARYTDVKQVAN